MMQTLKLTEVGYELPSPVEDTAPATPVLAGDRHQHGDSTGVSAIGKGLTATAAE
jgi:hypothetical protein